MIIVKRDRRTAIRVSYLTMYLESVSRDNIAHGLVSSFPVCDRSRLRDPFRNSISITVHRLILKPRLIVIARENRVLHTQ